MHVHVRGAGGPKRVLTISLGVTLAYIVLLAVSFFIFYEAFRRLQHPEHVQAAVMMWVAAAGVLMNGVIALLLYRSAGDVNIRSALMHEVGDTLSTAAVIAGGWAILVTD